jgi:hypothetical protein
MTDGRITSDELSTTPRAPFRRVRNLPAASFRMIHDGFDDAVNNPASMQRQHDVPKFMSPMSEDFSLSLDRQNQQNLAEWAVKGGMCSDTVEVAVHPRFFTESECHAFKQKRTIPDRTGVFAARFTGRSLDSNGVDFTLIKPNTVELLVRGHAYTVMVVRVVLQVLSSHPEPQHKEKNIRLRAADGPWDKLTIQVWPIEKKLANWPPPMSLSTVVAVTYYGHFRTRFKNETCAVLLTVKPKAQRSLGHPRLRCAETTMPHFALRDRRD